LFEKEFREESQSFNSIRQLIEKMKITIVWRSWMNFERFHEIWFQTDAFYLEKQKSFIPKKNIFQDLFSKHALNMPKDNICCPNFQWRFWIEGFSPRLVLPAILGKGSAWREIQNLHTYEDCNSKIEKSASIYCFEVTFLCCSVLAWIVGLTNLAQ
jgi:hypothetical protein